MRIGIAPYMALHFARAKPMTIWANMGRRSITPVGARWKRKTLTYNEAEVAHSSTIASDFYRGRSLPEGFRRNPSKVQSSSWNAAFWQHVDEQIISAHPKSSAPAKSRI